MTDKDIKEEVWKHFKDFQYVFLGTVEGDQPRVRPVTLIYFDGKLWITTGTRDAKVKQIQRNPKTEFCLYFREGDKDGYIRVSGISRIINNRKTKAKIAEHFGSFSEHWKSVDDPNYTLIEILPKEIEYLSEYLVQRFKP